MEPIYNIAGIVDTFVDVPNRIVYVKWHKLAGHEHMIPSLEAQAAEVKRGVRVVIVDVSTAKGVPTPEDQEYFVNTLFPTFQRAGLGALINVKPTSAITDMGTKRWSQAASGFGFDICDVGSKDDAFELAGQYTGLATT